MNYFSEQLERTNLVTANLHHLGFQAFAPSLHLRSWVQCYWLAQVNTLPAKGYIEKLYPDGGSTLTFYFEDSTLSTAVFDASYKLTYSHFKKQVNCLGIRFHPGGAYQLLGQQIRDVHGKTIQASALNLAEFAMLMQQLAESRINKQRLYLLNSWLLKQAERHQAQFGLIQYLWPKISGRITNINSLSQVSNLSRRQVERKFQQELGLSPSHFKLLHNVKLARQLIVQNPTHLLTDIGLASGFYDQAHFIRQFRQVTAQTPGQYRLRKMSQIYNCEK
jgi:AraC-like DNA-binding protein